MSARLLAALLVFGPLAAGAAPDVGELEQQAFQAAVARIAPCVVQIETIGGVEPGEQTPFTSAPTTGLIITADGYVVSSSLAFANRPASILVRLPTGTRRSAQLIATDHNRMLTLLKIEVPQPLSVPAAASLSQMRVGQWTIAVGRTFDGEQPNMTVGILSALGRVWGKALQTDAAVSPSNYGGPLIDIRGHVLGVLAPLAPQGDTEHSGVEWYDSGIGFAVPLEDILRVLPEWKKGTDLRGGLLGVSPRSSAIYTEPMVIGFCHPTGPARKAGLKPGDQIVEILGQKVDRTAQFKQLLGPHYAGEKIHLAVLRDKKRLERDLELVGELQPYAHPTLGFLPLRDGLAEALAGVGVRYVDAGGPAAKAGLLPGDRLVRFAGQPVKDRQSLITQLSELSPGDSVALGVERDGKPLALKAVLGSLPDALPPAELPPAQSAAPIAKDKPLPGATVRLKIPELPHEIWAYVPQRRDQQTACGLLIYLHGAEASEATKLLAGWKELCDRYSLIMAVPRAADKKQWQLTELPVIAKLLAHLDDKYAIDPERVVLLGDGAGATLALAATFRQRDRIRAAVLTDAKAGLNPLDNDPAYRQSFFFLRPAAAAKRTIEALRKKKFPVTVKELPQGVQTLTVGAPPDVTRFGGAPEIVRWIDMLDRI